MYGIKNLSGTGKTSLCRALAQQLSIRLKRTYPTSKLVEFDAHLLLSRYFGESGKLVTRLFGNIESMLEVQKNTFVVIFIDEVESLTSARQHSADSQEPRDALRVRVFDSKHAQRYLRKGAYRSIADVNEGCQCTFNRS